MVDKFYYINDMNIPKAKWQDYPPSIEFESTDLPLEIVREIAKLSLNLVNVKIPRDDVMSIDEGVKLDDDLYRFQVKPNKPTTRVYGPDVVNAHNHLIHPAERHKGLVAQARQLAKIAQLDADHHKTKS